MIHVFADHIHAGALEKEVPDVKTDQPERDRYYPDRQIKNCVFDFHFLS